MRVLRGYLLIFFVIYINSVLCERYAATPNDEICLLPIEKGECTDGTMNPTDVYGYNRETTQCEKFTYAGCGGNQNRFVNGTACWGTCYTSLDYFLAKVTEVLVSKYQ